ncbi:MAG TPA: NAD(P)/FAD-dependent oxidoreductase [Thermoprotei archaeon]|nr:NAD(P)/FAD-dependent oxidoreductase [Thermoprotei archaeon]
MTAKKVLIAGGGVGGVVAAKRLSERLKGKAEITLISDSDYFYWPPYLSDVAFGGMDPSEIYQPLSHLSQRGVKVVKAKITKIAPENRKVTTESGDVAYDYLIASLGSVYDFSSYGLSAGVHNYTLEGALKMREALSSFGGGKLVIFAPEMVHRCGMYPFELASRLDVSLRKRAIRDRAEITLIHPFKKPIQPLGREISGYLEERFQSRGINYVGGAKPVEIDQVGKKVVLEGEEVPYDLLVVIPPIRLPPAFRESGLTASTPAGEWTAVDPSNARSLKYDDVFLPGEHSMPFLSLPAAGVPVHFLTLSSAAEVAGEVLGEPVDPQGMSSMVLLMDLGDQGVIIGCDLGRRENSGLVWAGDHYEYKEPGLDWIGKCYSVLTSPLSKFAKDMVYSSFMLTSMRRQ